MLPGIIRRSRLMFHCKKFGAEPDFLLWKLKGSPRPRVPHLVKQRTLREYGDHFHLKVLIETGTQYGQMLNAMRKHFRDLYSIELNDTNYALAVRNFAPYPHVHLRHGDSAAELPRLLQAIAEPCLFWLDGHSDRTPVMDELRAIFAHDRQHVILIDDADCFGGSRYYPTLEAVRELTATHCPGAQMEVRDNIIRIHQP